LKKTIITLISSFLLCIFFAGCSTSNNETYFVHGIGFDKENDEYIIYAILEKAGNGKDNYFTATQKGKSIENAAKSITHKYNDCYFATSEFYFIKENASDELISDIAKEICDSNIYPSKSKIACIVDYDFEKLLSSVKSENDIKKIAKLTENSQTNAVRFFSMFTSDKKVSIPSLKIGSDEKFQKAKNIQYLKNEERI